MKPRDFIVIAAFRILGTASYGNTHYTADGLADMINLEYGLEGTAAVSTSQVRRAIIGVRGIVDDGRREGWSNPYWKHHTKNASLSGKHVTIESGGKEKMVVGGIDGTKSAIPVKKASVGRTRQPRLPITAEEKQWFANSVNGSSDSSSGGNAGPGDENDDPNSGSRAAAAAEEEEEEYTPTLPLLPYLIVPLSEKMRELLEIG